jgi:hypothetical protein
VPPESAHLTIPKEVRDGLGALYRCHEARHAATHLSNAPAEIVSASRLVANETRERIIALAALQENPAEAGGSFLVWNDLDRERVPVERHAPIMRRRLDG